MELLMSVAGLTEVVQVNAEASVIDTTSAKLGVNVSPEELGNLPVNGRNFANLMTLAPGATSDGNGGWSSVRFNGKSNQQNYRSSGCRRRWSRWPSSGSTPGWRRPRAAWVRAATSP
jgi:hypothetical protein